MAHDTRIDVDDGADDVNAGGDGALGERELATRPATELVSLLRTREISSRELLAHFLERNDRFGSDLNAIVTLDVERAERAAADADERLVSGNDEVATEPLLGLPMTIKDALATAGLRSTGGATELADHVPTTDAAAVAKVRQAGAVIFGKTNLPRWSADVQATNEIFGTTANPWDLARGPGGSSGGASAAVAAGLTAADLGTDIGGSVRLPAHFAGVCGHKPTFGIVAQNGYVSHPNYEHTQPDVNVIGPLARSVADLELLLDVISGPDHDHQPGWKLDLPPSRHGKRTDFRVAACLDDPLVPVSRDVAALLDHAVGAIESAGIDVTRDAWPSGLAFSDVFDVGLPLISAATSPARTDAEFDRFRDIVIDPTGVSDTLAMRARSTAIFHRDWLDLADRRQANRRLWRAFFDDFDVMLAPVAITAAFPHISGGTLYDRVLDVDGDERPYTQLIVWTAQFGYVGLPATVVPVGLTAGGLPVGIQIVGPFLGDRTCLAFARIVEELLGGYQVPPLATT